MYFSIILSILGIGLFLFFLKVAKKNLFSFVLLVIFFLPFERIGSIEIAGFTVRISQIFGFLLVFFYLLKKVIQSRSKLENSHLYSKFIHFWRRLCRVDKELPYSKVPMSASQKIIWKTVCVFLLIAIVSFLPASNRERAQVVLSFIVFSISVAFVISRMVDVKERVLYVLSGFVFTSSLASMFGLYQFLGDAIGLPRILTGISETYTKSILGFPRIQSMASEPQYFAHFLLISFVLLLLVVLHFRDFYNLWSSIFRVGIFKRFHVSYFLFKLLVSMMLALIFLNIILTFSRGAYVALIFVFLVVGIKFRRKILRTKIMLLLVLGVLFVFVISFAFVTISGRFSFENFTEHIGNITGGSGVVERIDTYQEALELFRESPFFGIGIGNFGPRTSHRSFLQPETGWPIVNNETLELFCETGIFGALAFYFFLGLIFTKLIKIRVQVKDEEVRLLALVFLLTLSAIWIQYQFFSTLWIMHFWVFIGILIGFIGVAERSMEEKDVSSSIK